MAESNLTLVRENGCTPQPAPGPGTKTVAMTVDGKPVMVPEGSLVIKACEQAQSPVPFYCYHPGLSVSGNCRICLVEIEGQKKLQIACNTRVTEGMSVKTTSDPVLEGRRGVLEYLLVNHPLDCPVCDQAGECWLQDYYMQHGLYDPKFNESKHKKPKKVPLGPTVMLDAERCILCSRCVRFTDEITKTGEFGIFNRGDHAVIGIQPGTTLDNNYSGNVVDVCPVGALTDRDFRFKCRVWYLGSTKSVCTGCSRGCNVLIQDNRERGWRPHIAGGDRIMRLKPRYHPDVNQWWMCDEGRYGYKFMDHDRLATVRVRDNGTVQAGTWAQGLDAVAGALKRYRDAKALGQVGVVLSSHQSNESLFAAKRFFSALGVADIVFDRPKPGKSDDLLLQADKSPNTRGAQALGLAEGAQALLERAAKGEIRMLYVCGADLAGLFGEAWRKAAERLDVLVFQGPTPHAVADAAHIMLPSAVHAEQDGTFTNFQGRVQRFWAAVEPLGDARPDWQIFGALAQALGVDVAFPDAPSVFAELSRRERAFAGLSYEVLGDQGALLRA